MANYRRTHLRTLEDEAVHVMRELAAECERPCLLFSGGELAHHMDGFVLERAQVRAAVVSH